MTSLRVGALLRADPTSRQCFSRPWLMSTFDELSVNC
jgi:hypothetical protein